MNFHKRIFASNYHKENFPKKIMGKTFLTRLDAQSIIYQGKYTESAIGEQRED